MDNSIYVQPCIQVLSPEAIARINESSLRILAEVGIRVDSTKALRVLKAAPGVTFLEEQHITIQPETNEETIALDDIARAGAGGNFISSCRTKKLCREAYHSSSIFPRLSFEKWQEIGQPEARKYLRERTLDILSNTNFPDDQHELLAKGEDLISHHPL